MPKLLSNFIEITLSHGCSPVNLLHIFKTPFQQNTSGWLFLKTLTEYTSTADLKAFHTNVLFKCIETKQSICMKLVH